MEIGEVWFVNFPLEEDPTRSLLRPVIVLGEDLFMFISVKVTSHRVRRYDSYDIEIIDWRAAGLRVPSTARVSKTIMLPQNNFLFKVGDLTTRDLRRIVETYERLRQDNPSVGLELNNMNLF